MQDPALLIALFPVNNVFVLGDIRVGIPLILRQADVKNLHSRRRKKTTGADSEKSAA